MFCVYLIDRDDGLKYVGKTILKRIKYRISSHKKTERFKYNNINYYILFISENHQEILEKETYFINYYNTYKCGLNKTPDGKAKNSNSFRFTTLGFHLSKNTKEKIGLKSKQNKNYQFAQNWWNNLSEEEKQKQYKRRSENFKGKNLRPPKFTEDIIRQLLLLYKSKPHLETGKCKKSGQMITFDRAFANKYAPIFNMSITSVRNIIQGKTNIWKPIYEEILNIKF